jgi:hypothetical protein
MTDAKPRRVRWKNIWITLLIIFGGLYLVYPAAMNVMVWHLARDISKDHPAVAISPEDLTENDIAEIQGGTLIQRFGYSVQFPFPIVGKQQDYKSITAVHFENGLVMLLMEPVDMLSVDVAKDHASVAGQLFSSHELESHYNYEVAVMNSRPSDVSLLHFRSRNARALVLLEMKSMQVSEKTTAIFKIEGPRIKGFQIGDPQVVPTSITLKLYDAKDGQIEIHLLGQKQSKLPAINQAQINAIVASIHSTN